MIEVSIFTEHLHFYNNLIILVICLPLREPLWYYHLKLFSKLNWIIFFFFESLNANAN